MDEFNISESEVAPKQIFEQMKLNIYNDFLISNYSSINKNYIYSRKSLFNILHKITNTMGFKSQTFFLCAHYLDIIFSSNKSIKIDINLLGLSALCLSAKYCENDPIVPHLQYFLKIYNILIGYKNFLSMKDLKSAEVSVLKLLDYKLNYYTSYDFNSFLFAHGILNFEQIKEMETIKNKRYTAKNKNNYFNDQVNSLMVKNILEKIYKKSRYFLDILVNKTKLCFKYNALLISIVIMRKSVNDILGIEQKIYLCSKEEQEEFSKRNFLYFKEIMSDFYNIEYESNEQYIQLMNEEEMKEILQQKEKTRNEAAPLAPFYSQHLEEKKEEEKENNNLENYKTNKKKENKSIFNSSVANGFYRRLDINFDEANKKRVERSQRNERNKIASKLERDNMSRSKEKTFENINTIINIKELKNSYRKINTIKNKLASSNRSAYNIHFPSKEKKQKKETETETEKTKEKEVVINNILQKKYSNFSKNNKFIPRIETYNNFKNRNTISNLKHSENKYHGSKYCLNKNLEIPINKNSPIEFDETCINNNYSNYSRMNKFIKIKGLNYGKDRNDYSFSITENYNTNNVNKKSCEKKPYYRKFASQTNNDNYASLNFNSTNNINLISDKNNFESINEESNRKKNLIINKYYTRINLKFPNKEKSGLDSSIIGNTYQNKNVINENNQMISTSSRHRRRFYNSIKNNRDNNDISSDIKSQNLVITNNNKKEIESYIHKNSNDNRRFITSLNFYKDNAVNKISVNVKNSENKNQENNKSFLGAKNRLSYLLGKQNSQLNNTLKEINLAYAKNKNEEKNNNEIKEKEKNKEINENTQNNNKDSSNIKVNFTKSIRQKYLNNNRNNKSSLNINNSKTTETIEEENKNKLNKIDNTTYNDSINNNSNLGSIFIKYRYSSKNKNNNNIVVTINSYSTKDNNNSNNNDKISNENQNASIKVVNEKEESKSKNNEKNSTKPSFYKIISKNRSLIKLNKNEEKDEENNQAKDKEKDKKEYKKLSKISNINFYKSQNIFYKVNKTEKNIGDKRNKEEIIKNQQDRKIGNNSYLRNIIYRNRLNKNNINTKSQKNASNFAVNNDINIILENKNSNITSEYIKYKNIYRKANAPTSLNINNSFFNSTKDNTIILNKNKNNENITGNNGGSLNNNIMNKFHFYRKTVGNFNSNTRNFHNIIANKSGK